MRGMVFVMSIWWDEGGFMNWFDSGEVGLCVFIDGDLKNIVKVEFFFVVIYDNMRWGEIGFIFKVEKEGKGKGKGKYRCLIQQVMFSVEGGEVDRKIKVQFMEG